MDGKKGFYIFIIAAVLLASVIIWGIASQQPQELAEATDEQPKRDTINGRVEISDVPPAHIVGLSGTSNDVQPNLNAPVPQMDEALMLEMLQKGGEDTQKTGEHGSLEGALITKTPMEYAPTRFERLPNSPLLVFTDEMIKQTGENTFDVSREAMHDQANHIQEASIALSVSPRVEMGKVRGYRLVEIPKGTLFDKMGLVSGDIIMTINGTMPDIEPMALAFVNMTASKAGGSTIEVEHRGVKRTIQLRAAE